MEMILAIAALAVALGGTGFGVVTRSRSSYVSVEDLGILSARFDALYREVVESKKAISDLSQDIDEAVFMVKRVKTDLTDKVVEGQDILERIQQTEVRIMSALDETKTKVLAMTSVPTPVGPLRPEKR